MGFQDIAFMFCQASFCMTFLNIVVEYKAFGLSYKYGWRMHEHAL